VSAPPLILEYDATPPSLNDVLYKHWAAQRRVKKDWQKVWATLLLQHKHLGPARLIEAAALMWFPTSRRRDIGNYAALLEKSLADALVEVGLIPDDTMEHFRFNNLTLAKGAPRTQVKLWLTK
jgi:hypothetical protein